MKLSSQIKLLSAAALGLTFSAIAAQAQLMVDHHEKATFGPFTGGSPNAVTNNATYDSTKVITSGTPSATPFNITYQPTSLGVSLVPLGVGTLQTSTFTFRSPITPANYFSSLAAVIEYDFDNNGAVDLTQNYTINLAPFTAPNGFTGVSYSIIPSNYFGNVTINGSAYSYASVVANSFGILFDGSSTTAAIQFQFIASPVPEPSTYALAGVLALGGITWLRRRRAALLS